MTGADKLTVRVATRLRVLRAVYDLVDGRSDAACSPEEIGERANVDRGEVEATLVYLQGEGLVDHRAEDYVEITHAGVVEYEAALSAPSRGTEHFPPSVIFNVTAASIGAIISGNENTTSVQQQHNQGVSRQDLEPLLDRLASQVETLDAEDQAEVSPALARVRREIAKPEPAWDKVTASLKYLETFTKLAVVVKTILALFSGSPG
jgi:hypothetical protein